jgi:hypothetical protein
MVGCQPSEGEGEEAVGYAIVVVAEEIAFVNKIAGDGFDAEGTDAVEVGDDGALALAGVLFETRGGDGGGVDESVVEDGAAGCTGVGVGMLQDLFDVLGGGEADGLVSLGHEVADVDAGGPGLSDGFGDAADEQVGDERGVERAGAEGDEVSVGDGFEGLRERVRGGGLEHQLDDALAGGGDVGLALDDGAVVHARGEADVGVGGREDAAADGEDLRGHLHGLGEVSGDVGEGGDEEVAEAVAFELALVEAEPEEAGEEVLVFGEGDHAVADVAGGQHLEVFAETAGGAAVIGDGDYGGEIADRAGDGGARSRFSAVRSRGLDTEAAATVRAGDVTLEAAEECGEAGAAADGYDAEGLICGRGRVRGGGVALGLHDLILKGSRCGRGKRRVNYTSG